MIEPDEMARLRERAEQAEIALKRERFVLKIAEQHAMRCDANQAAAEAALARAEARHAGLKANHLRTVADHRAELDVMTARAEQAEAETERLRNELGQLRLDDEIEQRATALSPADYDGPF